MNTINYIDSRTDQEIREAALIQTTLTTSSDYVFNKGPNDVGFQSSEMPWDGINLVCDGEVIMDRTALSNADCPENQTSINGQCVTTYSNGSNITVLGSDSGSIIAEIPNNSHISDGTTPQVLKTNHKDFEWMNIEVPLHKPEPKFWEGDTVRTLRKSNYFKYQPDAGYEFVVNLVALASSGAILDGANNFVYCERGNPDGTNYYEEDLELVSRGEIWMQAQPDPNPKEDQEEDINLIEIDAF